jgi:hypothetical protein
MSAKLQPSSWAVPLFGSIAILAIACFVQPSDPHTMPTPGAGLRHRPSAKAWRGHIASQQIPPALSSVPVIDPVLTYSTFLGGTNSSGPGGPQQQAYASFVDGPGNVYVTGPTNAPDFPVTPGTVQTTNPSGAPISFLTKINPAGTSLVFSTYLNLTDAPVLAVDASGNIFVGGTNLSFPIPSGTTPFQAAAKTGNSILIVKLNNTATTVLDATYLGGSGEDFLSGLAVDADGNLYVSGSTTSNDFPTKNPYQASLGSGGNSNFVAELDPALSTLLYSSYLGQSSGGLALLAVDASKNAYVVGTALTGFPVTSNALQATCASAGGTVCGTLAKLNPSASGSASLLYATYLGGASVLTQPAAVAVDSSQNVYISGGTNSGFPLVNSLQACSPITGNGFVAEVNAAGALAFSTCLGDNTIKDVVVDGSGIAYVTGSADATLALTNPIQAIANPPENAQFVAAINASAGSLVFSSFLSDVQLPSGTPNSATFNSVGVDSTGNIVVAGISTGYSFGYGALPFPTFNAFQPSPSPLFDAACGHGVLCSNSDAIIVKISPTAGAAAALTPASASFPAQQVGTSSAAQTVTVIDMGSDALTVSNATVTGDFSIQNGCASVAAAGGTCAIQVTFTPTQLGTRTGTVTITDSSTGSPRTVQLTGQGAQASAALSPASLSFPDQQPGTTSSAQTVTLSNSGALTLQISSVQITGPFAETNNCGSSVNATNGSCTINVTFTPTATGSATGTLTMTDSAPGSPQTVSLTGTGGTPSLGLAIASGGSASATVTAGATATYALTIGGSGMAGTASLTCTGAPTGATCSVPATVTLSATTASALNVSVSTTARSNVLFFPGDPTPWFWALALLGCLALMKAASAQQSPRLRWRLAPLLALALCACGGGSSTPTPTPTPNPNGTPAGAYTIVVTAKSGGTTQTQNLTLTVN